MQTKLIFLFIVFLPFELSIPDFSQLIVWNIGQGQWITYSNLTECNHFDVGGEFWNPKKIQSYCYKKLNRLYISHEDHDHISFGLKINTLLPKVCFSAKPTTQKKKFTKLFVNKYTECPETKTEIQQIETPSNFKTTNDASQIFTIKNVLIPGDSGTKMEKQWGHNLNPQTKILILGHHGSRTSTSDFLLNQLPKLKLAIASARHSRYGHPHLEVIERLKRFKIPLLRTEDWGNIHIILK